MEALSMSILAAYCTLLYTSTIVAESPVTPTWSPVPALATPETPDRYFDVTDYGAVGDGETESSSAFLEAWNAACSHTGNSTFYIPEGTFLLGPVSFTGPCYSNQSPNVKIKGTLTALPELNAFPNSIWIEFEDLQGVYITGENDFAIIDGQGAAEAWKQPSCYDSERCDILVTSLKLSNVTNGSIRNITVTNSKAFHIGINGCNNISISHVTLTAPGDSPNTDGIHVSESANVNITSSSIGVGDDCVSIGPGSIDVSVSNINCGPGHGISIGSLGKYKDETDVTGITVTDCRIEGTTNGVRIKTREGKIPIQASGILFQDIFMKDVKNPIIIDQYYESEQESIVKLSDIGFMNINGTSISEVAIQLECSKLSPCQNIHLSDINLKYSGNPNEELSSKCSNVEVEYHGIQSPPPCS